MPEGWQTSVDLDPRATNVVSASVEEMDDAIVLSTVDNARSLVRSLDTMRRSSSHVLSDLQQQQLHLDQQRGNMAITENERASVLRELSEAIQKQVKEQSQSGIQQELPQSHENRFLLGIEQDRNSSTITNNGLFFRFNTPGTKPDVTGGTQFNFALPPVQAQEADKRVEEKATLKRPAIAGKELQEGKSESRSQLLRNRDAKLRQNASEMKDGAATRGLQGDAFKKQSEVQLQQQMPDPFGLPAGIAIPNDSIKEDAQELLNSEAQQRESQGSLSLKFNLPTAGTELRFMRTTGNPTLALRIRNDESVTQLFKLGWLIVCGLTAVHALKASTFSLPATLKSVAFTVGAISLTGVILLNGDHAQVICGLVCLTAAVLFAAVLIWESYRKVDQYSGQ